MSPVESLLHRFALRVGKTRIGSVLFRSLDTQQAARAAKRERAGQPRAAVAFTWVVLVAISIVFYKSVTTQLEWPPEQYSDPRAFNLTNEGVAWDTFYGPPKRCGDLDCYVKAKTPDGEFQRQEILPIRESPLPGWERGMMIYHRAEIRLPQKMIDSSDTLLFHSLDIWAEKYEFYINGVLVDVGSRSLLNIPIPRQLIPTSGRLTLAFKIDAGDLPQQGISHFGDIVIGPKQLLEGLTFTAREVKTTYFLWYLLPRLSICVLFCFLFLSMSQNRENLGFFVFVLTSSLRIFLFTDYAIGMLPKGVSGHSLGRVVDLYESLFFVLFVEQYFRRNHPRFKAAIFACFIAITVGVSAAFLTEGGLSDFTEHIDRARFALRVFGATYAFYLAVSTAIYLAYTRKSKSRLGSALLLSGFLGTSVGCIGYEVTMRALGIPWRADTNFTYLLDLLLCLILAALVAFEFGSTVVQRDVIKTRMRTIVDPKIADKLVDAPDAMKGQLRDVTVLFADIRSFTTISEVYAAEQVVELLNSYFEVLVGVIGAHGGVVDKFIGDAVMAVWGAPVGADNDAEMAARCAVEVRRCLHLLNRRREAQGKFPFAFGVGIHTGRAIAGGIGSEQRVDYTVIGDTVNVASRVESATKELKTDIVLSRATYERIAGFALVSACGEIGLKGKRRGLELYKLIGMFDARGQLACYDEAYAAMPMPYHAGIIACGINNLRVYAYGDAALDDSGTSELDRHPRSRAS